jgi:hypothetical protein
MKNSRLRTKSIALLASMPLMAAAAATAAGLPMAVRLENGARPDSQLADLVRSNNQCVDSLKSGGSAAVAISCRLSLTRAEAMVDAVPLWTFPGSETGIAATTLAAVYSNVALAHWKSGNRQRALSLMARAVATAPDAAFIARNRLLVAGQ